MGEDVGMGRGGRGGVIVGRVGGLWAVAWQKVLIRGVK